MNELLTNKIVSRNTDVTDIPDNQLCTVYRCNNILEVISIQKRSHSLTKYKRLSKMYYCDKETGEILEYQKQSNRTKSLHNTFISLRRLINNNFTGNSSELMIVLTYNIHMTDSDKLYQDFRKFWLRLKYHYPLLEYIAVIEPQQNQSFHAHVLVKNQDGSDLFIPHDQLKKLWDHGITNISKITDVDNLGAYLCSYFTNIDILEGTELQKKYPQSKMIKKNAQLRYYPSNMRIFRCSKGIRKPQPITIPYSEVKELTENSKPVRQFAKQIVMIGEDDTEYSVNTIEYRQFNLKNKK